MADKNKKTITQSRKSVICDYCGNIFEKRHSKGNKERLQECRKPTVRPNQINQFRELCPRFWTLFCPIFNSLDTLSMNKESALDPIRYKLKNLSNSHWTKCPVIIEQYVQ